MGSDCAGSGGRRSRNRHRESTIHPSGFADNWSDSRIILSKIGRALGKNPDGFPYGVCVLDEKGSRIAAGRGETAARCRESEFADDAGDERVDGCFVAGEAPLTDRRRHDRRPRTARRRAPTRSIATTRCVPRSTKAARRAASGGARCPPAMHRAPSASAAHSAETDAPAPCERGRRRSCARAGSAPFPAAMHERRRRFPAAIPNATTPCQPKRAISAPLTVYRARRRRRSRS